MMARFINLAGRGPLRAVFVGAGLWAGLCCAGRGAQGQTATGFPLANLLTAPLLPPASWFASTDSQHQNKDYILLQPGETRRIPLAGGALERLWSTASAPDKITIQLDTGAGATLPLVGGNAAALGNFVDKTYTLFPATLASCPAGILGPGAALIAKNGATLPNKWFYQVTIRPLAHPAFPPEMTDYQVDHKLLNLQLAPGEEKAVQSWVASAEITQITAKVTAGPPDALHDLRLRAAWDGQAAVDASLAGLAGQVTGSGPVHSAVADLDGTNLTLKWPMPFRQGTMSLANTGNDPISVTIGVRDRAYVAPNSPYRFCAIEGDTNPQPGSPVKMLDIQGQGVLAGLALAITPLSGSARRSFAYLEGNESIIADGVTHEGTGTEDFFSSAWYFPAHLFTLPFQGLTNRVALPPSVSAYRLLLPDPVPFQHSLKFQFEHGRNNNTSDLDWRWVGTWYQLPPLKIPAAQAPTANGNGGTAEDAGQQPGKLWYILIGGILIGTFSYASRRIRVRNRKGPRP